MRPVPLRDYLDSVHHVGYLANNLHKPWQDLAVDVFEGTFPEMVIVHGGIGSGKSTFGRLLSWRLIYELVSLDDPARRLGLAAGSTISIAVVSSYRDRAITIYENQLLGLPYFKGLTWRREGDRVVFPKNIEVFAVRKQSSLKGKNLIGAIIDDANHVSIDIPKIVREVHRRCRGGFSRAKRVSAGLVYIAGSTQTGSNTDLLIRKYAKSPGCLVRHFATWDTHPERFSPHLFRVKVDSMPRIPEKDDVDLPGVDIVYVPEDFRADFIRDTVGALRDLAGIAV